MPLDRTRCRPLLQSFNFTGLFMDELGWDKHKATHDIQLPDRSVRLEAIAHKRGFVAWHCPTPPGGKFPDAAGRRRIEREATKAAHEHLIVFTDSGKTRQIWQWVRREPGQPLRVREVEWAVGQSGELILQKLDPLFVSFDDEESITLMDVAGRARANVDERITKKFYAEFTKQHTAFLKFITGIPNQGDHEWYASVMLNRLMFVYFVQRKGFLDGDTDYLRNRLNALREKNKGDKFYTFYRYFLLKLFHQGLGAKTRKPELEKLIGRVPYLNGGIFDVHQLERDYGQDIQIPDKAFERIFDYFDQYQWHLDERPLRADNEINPDVLGYIFEKYINQKQMGAYYTKEDITEYISKSTIIPFLFDAARARCTVAFENPHGPTVWDLLRENPDRYIYPAVRHGCHLPLPQEIAAGLDTSKPDLIERRQSWNKPAPAEYALPTEIWREVVARRQRCKDVRRKLAAGEVREVNDFITLNLDLRQFAQDVIQNCEGPDLLMAFWNAISTITVLDPTGGSGAFIFAALNILEPLYEASLDRMEAFLAEWGEEGKKAHPNYDKKFTEVLANVAAHPNRRYFVLKSIMLNNLYAVDIMEEAVEICKLRLFLKLAAQVEPDAARDNLGIEPLPDIDFNIKCGNTLVGFATETEVRRCMKEFGDGQMKLLDEGELGSYARFNTQCADLQQTFDKFRQLQTEGDGSVPAAHKLELQKRLKALEDELSRHLAGEYGVKVSDKVAYAKWLKSHQPFHWFIQFYGILNDGGFDVIIGNPPYVEYKDVFKSYQIRNVTTKDCSNLFAYVLERCTTLSRSGAAVGMIIPLSAFSTDRMIPLINHLKKHSSQLRIANFSWRPGKLFDGVHLQLSIVLQRVARKLERIETTRYLMWDSEARPELFSKVEYATTEDARLEGCIPKLGSEIAASILAKLRRNKKEIGACFTRSSRNRVLYRRGGLYWKVFVDFETGSSEEKIIHVLPEVDKYGIIAVLSSGLWWWYFTITSDCRHLGNRDIFTFPFDPREMSADALKTLCSLGRDYVKDLKLNAEKAVRVYKGTKAVECLSFRVNQSKPILDEIDAVLAGHYGLTEEELDFILNYDIKYRLGRSTEDE